MIPRGDQHARGQALDVPLKWGGQRLVEVVDVEHEAPIRRGEEAEVEQVGVAAGLHPNVRRRRMGQIPRHRCRGSAEVRELGRRHPAMADLDHVRQAALLLLLQDGDRIRPVGRRIPLSVARTADSLALRSTALPPLLRGQHLVRRRHDPGGDLGHGASMPPVPSRAASRSAGKRPVDGLAALSLQRESPLAVLNADGVRPAIHEDLDIPRPRASRQGDDHLQPVVSRGT